MTSYIVTWQDCGKPYYITNYLAFFYAIKQYHPDITLIANCNMGQDAPTEMWDWCDTPPPLQLMSNALRKTHLCGQNQHLDHSHGPECPHANDNMRLNFLG
jgi:hypothetical protein